MKRTPARSFSIALFSFSFSISLLLMAACGPDAATPTATPRTSPPASVQAPAPPPVPSPLDAGPLPSPLDAGPPPAPIQPDAGPPPTPVKVARAGKAWPFHAWNRAEALTFNDFPMRQVPEVVYDDAKGWSPHIVQRKPLTDAVGKSAFELVRETQGEVSVSKCPFPRHAVVLYDGDLPVASINVCFSCGDIVLWPRWTPYPKEGASKTELDRFYAHGELQQKLYRVAFPKWEVFFRDTVGYPIDKPYPPPNH